VLDGLWLGGDAGARLELAGTWDQVTLRRITLDPGGTDTDGNAIAAIPLRVTGTVRRLTVAGCILGPIGTSGGGVIEALGITDSIVQSRAAQPAIALAPGRTTLKRVTVLGDLALERLYATETLVLGTVVVADTQWGCFRFSAAYAGSRLPHPFASTTLAPTTRVVASRRFGDPHYAQIAETAPEGVRRGAETGAEIGAFSALNAPILLDGLSAKVTEYMPFGLVPAYLLQS
jgi:hypothetical protein